MQSSLALIGAIAAGAAPQLLDVLPDDTPVHLGVTLRLNHPEELHQLLADQQDPRSPLYRTWLDPRGFAERFGTSASDYDALLAWFAERGFEVTSYPNRLFFEAAGGVRAVRQTLGVQERMAQLGGRRFRTHAEPVQIPESLRPAILHISGLDTRPRLRHRLSVLYQGSPEQVLGPSDLRVQYDLQSLIADGNAAAGLTTVVLGTQEGTSPGDASSCRGETPGAPFIPPSADAIQGYEELAGATAAYQPIVLSNPNNDFDRCGANAEVQLDVEMQSVGAAEAANIDLVLSPASEIFQTGAQYIVNTLSNAVTVSTSIGLCEAEAAAGYGGGPDQGGSEMQALQQAVQQGLAEGQTWFAASGDTGADDCDDSTSGTGNGAGGGNATVDFPASVPEMVAVGGTQFLGSAAWGTDGSLLAAASEQVWNESETLGAQGGGAGGGGQSRYFSKPSYQAGIGPGATDGQRDLPDIALTAASNTPGVAVYDCGNLQDQTCAGDTTGAGQLTIYGGTSVGSPLAAGFFALVAHRVGCHLGDVHGTLYQLGSAQQSGGPKVFNDITTGNNSFDGVAGITIPGFSAGPGYDLATGWGTLDVAALADNWPGCGAHSLSSGGCSCAAAPSETLLLWVPLGVVAMAALRRRTRR